MPIKKCTKDGKHGYSWGDGPCIIRSTPEEAKKTVIRMGIKIEGPEKFAQVMKKEHSKGQWSSTDFSTAQQILFEESVCSNVEDLDITRAYIPAEERNKIQDENFAGPNRTFPIRNQADVEHAAMLLHHATNPSEVKKNIIRIAHRKGLHLPATWEHEK